MFAARPESGWDEFFFMMAYSFYTGLAGTAGHELVHRREMKHKIIGSLPYFSSLYSHFAIEHTGGHHKDIATPNDPVSHKVGSNLYGAIFSAVVRTHTHTWNREIERIKKHTLSAKGREPSYLEYAMYNVMVAFFVMHVALILSVYALFGKTGLLF